MLELLRLVGVCLKVGALVFGGGLVMVPLMQPDVVDRYGWVTEEEFLDAVAMGQVTPGPLLVTATFLGYKVCLPHGIAAAIGGGILATLAMFIPSFVMTLSASHQLRRLQDSPRLQAALKGVQSSVVGLIGAAAVILVRQGGIVDWQGVMVAALALFALIRWQVQGSLVVLGGGALGLLLWRQ